MNKIYRSIWNEWTGTFVAVAETTKTRGKRVGSQLAGTLAGPFGLQPLALALLSAGLAQAAPPVPIQLPTNGSVVSGQASISQTNAVMTINQSSNRAVIDWGSFNIGSAATVNFVQPSSSSAILNRVLDANPSQIFGNINANGQVFLTNASGIYFGQNATINVGAFTATTHSIGNADFMAGNLRLSRDGATGSVVNDGTINAALGGYVALLAPEVRNNGLVVAQMGTVALAAGEAYELQFDGVHLASVRVEPATIAALVENKQAVQAPGGLIILSAQAANRLQGGVVNNSGSLEATGLVEDGGTIRLSASDRISHSGSIKADAAANSAGNGGSVSLIADLANANSVTEVNGSISARAGGQGGNGGFIETSGGQVQIGSNAVVDTTAPQGKTGRWLIDPVDYIVTAGAAWGSSNERTGWNLSDSLRMTDVSISATNNIYINDTVWWNVNHLTLSAGNDVNVNSLMTMAGTSTLSITTGSSGKLNMGFDAGGTFKGRIDLPGRSGAYLADGTTPILTINGSNYTIINSLGAQGSATATDLQGIAGNLSGKYALGSDVDASATSSWNAGGGFAPLGDGTTPFSGVFDGLGHSVNHLTVNRPSDWYVGLFGNSDSNSILRNVGVTNASITGAAGVGVLAGYMYGNVFNTYATGTLAAGSAFYVGGLIGFVNGGSVDSSHANVRVTNDQVTPLPTDGTGGLVGQLTNAMVSNSYANGAVVSGGNSTGGLIGVMTDISTLNNVYATGAVTSTGQGVGGLVGSVTSPATYSGYGVISNAYATGAVTGGRYAGGLVGRTLLMSAISNAFASGNVSSTTGMAGGLIGSLGAGTLQNVFATGNVVSGSDYVGGLLGMASNNRISEAYATGNVTVLGGQSVGGLIGGMQFGAQLSQAYATGAVASDHNLVGGLVGTMGYGGASISNAYATGSVTGPAYVGGLVGGIANFEFGGTSLAAISNSMATGAVHGVGGNVGGLIGGVYGRGPMALSNVYWNTETTGVAACISGVACSGASGKTTAELKDHTLYDASWDTAVWNIDAADSRAPNLQQSLIWSGAAGDGKWATAGNWSTSTGSVGVHRAPTVLDYADLSDTTASIELPQITVAGKIMGDPNVTLTFTGNLVSSLSLGSSDTMSLPMLQYGASGKVNLAANPSGVYLYDSTNSAWQFYTVINALGSAGSTTGTDLQGINGNLSGAYVLGMDIDASDTAAWNGGKGFVPIAPTTVHLDSRGRVNGVFDGTPFSGSLNGLGHSVIQLTINDATLNNVGLLGYVVGSAGVSNVGVVDASISARSRVGGLIGSVTDGGSGLPVPLTNLWASGSVAATKFTRYNFTSMSDAGGLVGYAVDANISIAHADVEVSGQDANIGGLIGSIETNSTLNNSYATGNVTGRTAVGGLLGFMNDNSGANYVYATGNLTGIAGNSAVGGLVGYERSSTISYATATGVVTGDTNVGGLIGGLFGGANDSAPSIQYVRASGDVFATGPSVGGLVGIMQGSGIAAAKASGNVTGTYSSATDGWIGGLVGYLYGSSYGITGVIASGNVYAPNASKVGGLVGYSGISYVNGYASGAVTGLNYVGGLIGYLDGGGSIPVPIQGGTDFVLVTGNDNVGGLIGTVSGSSGAVFVGSGYSNANVSGHSNVGGLIGQVSGSTNGASVRKTYSTVDQTVTATGDNVGGLIGYVDSNVSIDQVYASSTVHGDATNSHYVGGLIGHWQGDGSGTTNALTNAYADGAVTGADKVGGLIGEIDVNSATGTATVAHVYARGAVTTPGSAGGLLASKTGSGTASVADAYWDTQTTGQATSADGAGKATTAMQAKATYANFDFTSGSGIWRILAGANSSYPQLCVFAGGCNSDNGSGVAVTTTSAYLRLVAGSSLYGDAPTLTYQFYTAASGGTLITDAGATGSVVWSTPLSSISSANTYSESYLSGITLGNSAYSLSAGNAVNWVISPRPLNVAVTKVYDGSASFGYSAAYVFTGMVNGNAAPVASSGSATVSGKNVGNYTAFGNNTLTLSDGNYTLVGGNVSADITPRALTVSAPTVTKTYDGNTSATGAASVGALASGDSVSTAATLAYTDKNFGLGNKTVQATGVTIRDASNADMTGNYDISYIDNTVSTINKVTLTVSGTTVANKTYDGGTAAALSGGRLIGVLGSEVVTLTQAGVFADKNVGAGKTVTALDTLGGADAVNYALTQPTGLRADINAVPELPPVAPQPPAPPLPAQGQGLQVPATQGLVAAPVPSSQGAGGAERFAGITVSVEPANAAQQGMVVTVEVPRALATSGSGFSFALPEQVANGAQGAGTLSVRLANGDPLPGWLKYNPDSRVFTVLAASDSAFPLQLVVTRGTERTLVVISVKGP